MFCTSCGSKLPDSAKFCTNCGARPDSSKSQQQPSVPREVNPGQQPSVPREANLRQQPSVPQRPPSGQAPPPLRKNTGAAATGVKKPTGKKTTKAALIAVIILCVICMGVGAAFFVHFMGGGSLLGTLSSRQEENSPRQDDEDSQDRRDEEEAEEDSENEDAENEDTEDSGGTVSEEDEQSESAEETPVTGALTATSTPDTTNAPPAQPTPSVPSAQNEPYEVPYMRDYIIPDSNARLLEERELARYSNAELVIARNEIYARHGYIFGSKILVEWFENKWWYVPVYENDKFPDSILSSTEKKNIELLLEYRNRRNNGEVPYQGNGAEDLYYYQYFFDSNTRYLSDTELMDMTKDNLEIAMYEIYARKGLEFTNPKWREYYKSFIWYTPKIPESRWDDSMLNNFERANISLIQYYMSQA